MTAEGYNVGAESTCLYGELHIRLHTVRMCDYMGITALNRRKSLLNWEYVACFVVDVHHADKAGVLAAGTYEVSRIEASVLTGRNADYLEALFLKVSGSLLNGGVLHCGNNYFLCFSSVSRRSAAECKVVALGSSRGEIYTVLVGAYAVGNGFSCAVHDELSVETCPMEGRGIPVILGHG